FFFSSRRRHTRFSRDWSSDVCSSDLKAPTENWRNLPKNCYPHWHHSRRIVIPSGAGVPCARGICFSLEQQQRGCPVLVSPGFLRSEERRVGKECRSRWVA